MNSLPIFEAAICSTECLDLLSERYRRTCGEAEWIETSVSTGDQL